MNICCIGAHPDDCEWFAGGTAVKWARLGHQVLFVSATNGDIGHHEVTGGGLAQRRIAECERSAEIAGVKSLILGHHDGELQPTLDARKEIVRIIREHRADMVITHRPWDYHPDHRYTSVLVQDAAFMVTVPHFCPATPRLDRNPVFFYMSDPFTKPAPFRADVAVDIDEVMDVKWAMLDAMESQVYEWLPWLEGFLDKVPPPGPGRIEWMRNAFAPHFLGVRDLAREAIGKWYGAEHATRVRFVEAFELCEYGTQPSDIDIRGLFPFFL